MTIEKIVQAIQKRGYPLREATDDEIKKFSDLLRTQPGKLYICNDKQVFISHSLVAELVDNSKEGFERAVNFYEKVISD